MKIAFKNFLTTLRRYKTASALNIAGLTLAFTAFYVIMAQVCYEMTFNRSIPHHDRIYMLSADWGGGSWIACLPRPVTEQTIAAVPDAEAGGALQIFNACDAVWVRCGDYDFTRFDIGVNKASASLFDALPFRTVAGDLHEIASPDKAVVSARTAERLGVGVGDVIYLPEAGWGVDAKPSNPYVVAGIFDDFAKNTVLGGLRILVDAGEDGIDENGYWNYSYFVRLREGADPAVFERAWTAGYAEWYMGEYGSDDDFVAGDERQDMKLVALGDMYYGRRLDSEVEQGSRGGTLTMLGIALLIVLVAFVNFVNFFFALIPVRIRSVNTRKIFGASARTLRLGFVAETACLVAASLVVAYCIVIVFADMPFADYISASVDVGDNPSLASSFAVGALLLGMAVSIYPAWYITSFRPAMVIKGSFSATSSGRTLRYVLVGLQYVISIALIVAALFIRLQHSYMMNYDMGFDKSMILTVQNVSGLDYNRRDALFDRLKSNPIVEDAAMAACDLVTPQRMGWGRNFKGDVISFQSYPVSWNLLAMMGIGIAEGRDFTAADEKYENGTFIFNDAARRQFSLTLEDRVPGHAGETRIAGFCEDFNFMPLQYGIEPFAFYVFGAEPWWYPSHLYVRVAAGTDMREARRWVESTVREMIPELDPAAAEARLFDAELEQYYRKEQRLSTLITVFSLLSILISMMGVFGLVLFETQYRRKEIGIRRVNGASVGGILRMFNMQFLRVVGICTVIAIPVSWYFVDRWLSGFSYRMPMHWWVFALAALMVALITVATVTVRSWRASNENPVNAIQH